MALPSLAIGLGMQGQPKDYANILMARKKGKEAAQAKADAARQKELEKYGKHIMDWGAKERLPIHNQPLREAYASALQTYERAMDGAASNIEVMEAANNVEQMARTAQLQYKLVDQLSRSGLKSGIQQDAINAVLKYDTFEDLNAALANIPGNTLSVDENLNITGTTYPYEETFSESVNKMLNNPAYYDYTSPSIVRVGSRNYGLLGLKSEVSDMVTEAMQSPAMIKSAELDYAAQLRNQGKKLPDRTTEQGRAEWDQGVSEFMGATVKKISDIYSKSVSADRGRASGGAGDPNAMTFRRTRTTIRPTATGKDAAGNVVEREYDVTVDAISTKPVPAHLLNKKGIRSYDDGKLVENASVNNLDFSTIILAPVFKQGTKSGAGYDMGGLMVNDASINNPNWMNSNAPGGGKWRDKVEYKLLSIAEGVGTVPKPGSNDGYSSKYMKVYTDADNVIGSITTSLKKSDAEAFEREIRAFEADRQRLNDELRGRKSTAPAPSGHNNTATPSWQSITGKK